MGAVGSDDYSLNIGRAISLRQTRKQIRIFLTYMTNLLAPSTTAGSRGLSRGRGGGNTSLNTRDFNDDDQRRE